MHTDTMVQQNYAKYIRKDRGLLKEVMWLQTAQFSGYCEWGYRLVWWGWGLRTRSDLACKFGDCRQMELKKILKLINALIINFYYCFCWIFLKQEMYYSSHRAVTWHHIFLSIYSDTCSPPPVDLTLWVISTAMKHQHVWEGRRTQETGDFLTKLHVSLIFHFSVRVFF